MELLEHEYLSAIQDTDPKLASQFRQAAKNLRSITGHIGLKRLLAFDTSIAPLLKARFKSGAVYASYIRGAIVWAQVQGRLRPHIESFSYLQMPTAAMLKAQVGAGDATTYYKREFCTFMLARRLRRSDLTNEHMYDFFRGFVRRRKRPDRAWRKFALLWSIGVREGLLPDLKMPLFPNYAAPFYRIKLTELPSDLGRAVERLLHRLATIRGAEEYEGGKLSKATISNAAGALLRLLGFQSNICGQDLSLAKLRDLVNPQSIWELIVFTAIKRRNPDNPDLNTPGEHRLWYYQDFLLQCFYRILYIGLNDANAVKLLKAERKRYMPAEPLKDKSAPPSLNDHFRVALALVRSADQIVQHSGLTVDAMLMYRDSLIIALIGSFAHRHAIIAKLDIDHVNCGAGRSIYDVPKGRTKPGLRDSRYVLPEELHLLFTFYFRIIRPLLCPAADEQSLFLTNGGKGLSKGRVREIYVNRMRSELGTHRAPHLARHSWATEFAQFSNCNYWAASMILDASPLTIERRYTHIKAVLAVQQFDRTADALWERALLGKVA